MAYLNGISYLGTLKDFNIFKNLHVQRSSSSDGIHDSILRNADDKQYKYLFICGLRERIGTKKIENEKKMRLCEVINFCHQQKCFPGRAERNSITKIMGEKISYCKAKECLIAKYQQIYPELKMPEIREATCYDDMRSYIKKFSEDCKGEEEIVPFVVNNQDCLNGVQQTELLTETVYVYIFCTDNTMTNVSH